MFEITKNNHVKWGVCEPNAPRVQRKMSSRIDENTFVKPIKGQGYFVEYCRPTRPHLGMRAETFEAAKDFSRMYPKVMVSLSGGIDSQAVALAFVLQDLPFTPLIVRYEVNGDCINYHDIEIAYQFCARHNLKYEELTLDPRDCWFHANAQEFIDEHMIWSYLSHTFALVGQIYGRDYCVLICGGEPQMYHTADGKDWLYHHQCLPHSHFLVNMNLPGVTKFFWWTPELIASTLDVSYLRAWRNALPSHLKAFDWWTSKSNRMLRPYTAELFHDFGKPLMWVQEFPEIIQAKKHLGNERFKEVLGGEFMTKLNSQYQKWYNLNNNELFIGETFEFMADEYSKPVSEGEPDAIRWSVTY